MVLTDPAWFFWSMTQGSLISSFDKDLLQELFVKITLHCHLNTIVY